MMRFYFNKPDAKVTEMSPASREAWIACHRVVQNLPEQELAVITAYYRADRSMISKPGFLKQIADENGITWKTLFRTIDKVSRLVIIERGLADR